MFHRLAPSPHSARLLHFATLAAIIVMIATAVAFALQAGDGAPTQATDATSCGNETWPYRDGGCRDDTAEKSRSIRLVSPDRIQKTTVYTSAARVDSVSDAPAPAAEPAVPTSTEPEEEAVLPPAEEPTPSAASTTLKVPAVSPRARAQAPRRIRSRHPETRPTLGLGLAPRDKSYLGAGGGFDAVH
jgi:hypothetical protein